jgi:hypothetical protein
MKQEHRLTSGFALGTQMTTLAIGLIAVVLSGAASFGEPVPQMNSTPLSNAQTRGQAPIGHRQPRVQDLPPGLQREQGGATADQRALDKKLQICRPC